MITLNAMQSGLFESDACMEIDKSHEDGWRDITRHRIVRPQWEPRFVAYLCAAMLNLAGAWRQRIRRINPGLRLSVSAVFTHQSPYVKWTNGRCELADLLVAFINRTAAPGAGQAILVQAKQADGTVAHLATKSEKTQFELLTGRPQFDVDMRCAPAKVNLHARRAGHDEALLYAVNPPKNSAANPPPWGPHRWHSAGGLAALGSGYKVALTTCLAETLVAILRGKVGWDFALPPAGATWSRFSAASRRDDWAMLINYLLEVTFGKPLKTLRSVVGTPGCGGSAPLFFKSQSPVGKTMFFYTDAASDESDMAPMTWISGTDEGPNWFPVSNSPLNEFGVGGDDREDPGSDDYEPDNGPISAIVFEVEPQDSHRRGTPRARRVTGSFRRDAAAD